MSRQEAEEPRQLSADDLGPATKVLAQAFRNDPLLCLLEPDDKRRSKLLPELFGAVLRSAIDSGQAYGVSSPAQAVAIWNFPEKEQAGVPALLHVGFVKLLFNPRFIALLRSGRVFARLDTLRRKNAPGPHYYLTSLGVLPAVQGRGLASSLLRPFLARATELGLNVYTDTVARANVAMYRHLGFECMEELAVPGTGVTVWSLLRRPDR